MTAEPLIEVADLAVRFAAVEAVRGVSFTVGRAESVALVGESGSGKSVTARALLGLTGQGSTVSASALRVGGADASRHRERQWRELRGRLVGYVLQDALVSLDPLRPVGREISEALRLQGGTPRDERPAKVLDLLRDVGVPEPELRATQYPHQLSGGLRQRALIASAIAGDPALLIADEPTTALDVTVQAQILRLLAERRRAGTALLLISHDLAVVAEIADRVLVMKDGVIVESGETEEVLTDPSHPYTRSLLAAVPTEHTKGLRLSVSDRTAPPPPAPAPPGDVVVEARGLVRTFAGRTAVDKVSFRLRAGETLGLVGESGSGKSTLARLVLGLLEPDEGEVEVYGESWAGLPDRDRRRLRRRIQAIHQDPLSSFDPRFSVRRLLEEALMVRGVPRAERRDRAVELLEQVGLGAELLERRPLRLSGGQRQRVAIARALATDPSVLVCDEPVSALDVSVQAQVLDLLADLRAERGMALLFISHHLGVIHHVSDRVAVLHEGRVVETGDVRRVFTAPEHPYTRSLLEAVPRIARPAGKTPEAAS